MSGNKQPDACLAGKPNDHPPLIRAATDADVPALVAVLKAALAEQATLDPPSGALKETDARVRAVLQSGARASVAVVEGKIIGCLFHAPENDALYLFRLAVLPAYRRGGIARALLDHGEALARQQGLPKTRLSVRLALPRQRAWYERRGYAFVAHGTHAGHTAPTSATLEKSLME